MIKLPLTINHGSLLAVLFFHLRSHLLVVMSSRYSAKFVRGRSRQSPSDIIQQVSLTAINYRYEDLLKVPQK